MAKYYRVARVHRYGEQVVLRCVCRVLLFPLTSRETSMFLPRRRRAPVVSSNGKLTGELVGFFHLQLPVSFTSVWMDPSAAGDAFSWSRCDASSHYRLSEPDCRCAFKRRPLCKWRESGDCGNDVRQLCVMTITGLVSSVLPVGLVPLCPLLSLMVNNHTFFTEVQSDYSWSDAQCLLNVSLT